MPRKLTLSDGREAEVGVRHVWYEPGELIDHVRDASVPRRGTEAWLRITNSNVVFIGASVCSPKDHFSKAVGRRLAANKLLQHLRDWAFTHEDREAVFNVICPEYAARAASSAEVEQ